MIIHELSLEQRPRERLNSEGVGRLSDAELLALLLEKGLIKFWRRLRKLFCRRKFLVLRMTALMLLKAGYMILNAWLYRLLWKKWLFEQGVEGLIRLEKFQNG